VSQIWAGGDEFPRELRVGPKRWYFDESHAGVTLGAHGILDAQETVMKNGDKVVCSADDIESYAAVIDVTFEKGNWVPTLACKITLIRDTKSLESRRYHGTNS
jgi:hypothetical protein